MYILYCIVFGLTVGALARLVVSASDRGGWVASIVIGIAGAFGSGFLGRAFSPSQGGTAAGFLMSLVGAVVLLIVYHGFLDSRRGSL